MGLNIWCFNFINNKWFLTVTWFNSAKSERISSVALIASTRWKMIHNLAVCILATCPWARILAFISYTGAIWRAIRIQNTFRSATFIRISNIVGRTGTCSCTILFSALCIWSTRVWIAWSRCFINWFFLHNWALSEWISTITCQTDAHWSMANHTTFCIGSTGSRTRISAFLVDACQIARTFCIIDTFRTTIGWRSYHVL
jgi:hypothetical protein